MSVQGSDWPARRSGALVDVAVADGWSGCGGLSDETVEIDKTGEIDVVGMSCVASSGRVVGC